MESVAICVVQLPGTVRGKSKIKFVAAGGCEKTERGKHPKHRPAKNAGRHGLAHLEKGNLVRELGVVVHGCCFHARLRVVAVIGRASEMKAVGVAMTTGDDCGRAGSDGRRPQAAASSRPAAATRAAAPRYGVAAVQA